jgi:hypothetical protein
MAQKTDPIAGLVQNIEEVDRLLAIHEQIGGATRGRKHNLEVLNKSGIVLLVACWEAFIEDLASAAFDAMLMHATDHTIFPADVLAFASRDLKSAPDHREVWKLAGTGWKTVLQNHKAEVFKTYIGKLNTPKPKQIDSLFTTLIGISSLSSKWSWRGMSPDSAVEKLNRLVELRGSIAHRVAAAKSVHKSDVTAHVEFIYRLAVRSSNRTRAFVRARVKHRPWPTYYYGEIR